MRFLLPLLILLVLSSCSPRDILTDEAPPTADELPDPIERGDIRFFIMSDLNSSYGSTDYQWQVDSTVVWLPRYAPDMVLSAGDLVAGQLRDLTDEEISAMWDGFEKHIADSLQSYNLPYAPAMGNHDGSNAHEDFQRERDKAKEFFNREEFDWGINFVDQANFPFWYSFEIGDIFFLVWDATSARIPEEALDWTEDQLQSERAQEAEMRMMMGHLSLYPVAVDRNRLGELLYDADDLLAMMETYDVHTYISGHSHAYYPGRRGDVDLLHTGATGSGPRQILGNPDEPRHTFTILDVWPDEGRTVYTTVDAHTAEVIEKTELPIYTEGVNGFVVRRDAGMASGFRGKLFPQPTRSASTKTTGTFDGNFDDGILEISGELNLTDNSETTIQIGEGSLFNQDSVITEKTVESTEDEFEFTLENEIDPVQQEQLKVGRLHVAVRDKQTGKLRYKGQILNQANTAPLEPADPDAEWEDESLEITWEPSQDPDNDPVHYIIQISDTSDFEKLKYSYHAGAGTDSKTITGIGRLLQDDDGYFRIIATDGVHRIKSETLSIP